MAELTLLRRGHPLASADKQCRVLSAGSELPTFERAISNSGIEALRPKGIFVLQVNVGRLCNQTCHHCHVDAGPDRRESMSRETAEACIRALAATEIRTLDITGGAPEMNPNFRYLVEEGRRLGRHVIDRCNLTILTTPGFEDLAQFLATNQVEVVASLPCYLEDNCDRQRGNGVFKRSIQGLKLLNELGYGRSNSELKLTLVYNPVGPVLPPPQETLETDYRRELSIRYGIEFTRLITITNMPISRFLDDLLVSGSFDEYMHTLVAVFNPATVEGLMCRSMISVDWQGRLFDCDFNQMLELPIGFAEPPTIHDFDLGKLLYRRIATGRHCFGCTAGVGSSCQGSVVKPQP
ncbi:MAG: arsenosugar biosynthesis radical SAM (seleno)protein ArsS [Pirellulales bacterium]